MQSLRRQAGVTLVELVISIVIISVALVGVLLVMNQTTRHSADPLVQHQAVAAAQSYLEEILLKGFRDPSLAPDPDAGKVCPGAEGGRALYDNVCDYAGIDDNGARDQSGTAIAGLDGYRVRVEVRCDASLHTLAGNADCEATDVLRVDVRVTHAGLAGLDITLSGYRTWFP